MITDHTAASLISFEEEIAAAFNRGEIPFPVHLTFGNEEPLLEIFESIRPRDWIFGSWRMHYHALLKGVSPEALRAAILRGESMALCFEEQRVYGSAIVTGTLSIALGAAMAVKRRGDDEMVWLFCGDMTAETGGFHEVRKYADNFSLPLKIVVEDNGKSVCTNTRDAWGFGLDRTGGNHRLRRYFYESKWPHAGAGQRVQF